MSFEAIQWAWEWPVKSSTQRLVLLALADFHNAKTGLCCPSIASISVRTALNRKPVMSAIDALIEQGAMTAEKRTGAGTKYSLRMFVTSTTLGTSTESGTGTTLGTRPVPDQVPDQYQIRDTNQELTRKEPPQKHTQGGRFATDETTAASGVHRTLVAETFQPTAATIERARMRALPHSPEAVVDFILANQGRGWMSANWDADYLRYLGVRKTYGNRQKNNNSQPVPQPAQINHRSLNDVQL